MIKAICLTTTVALLLAVSTAAAAELPLDVYGRLDSISSMAVSPDGDRVAFRRTDANVDAVFVLDRASGEVLGAVDGSETNLRSVSFLDQDRLILFAEESEHMRELGARLQIGGSFLYDLRTNELTMLLKGSRHVYPLQSGGGRIVGHNPDTDAVYMPTFIGKLHSTPPTYGLLEVTPDNLDGRLVTRGSSDTIDWFVDGEGRILAEEEYDVGRKVRRIWGWRDDKRVLIYESGPTAADYAVVGLSQDYRSLIVSGRFVGSEFSSYFEMSLEDGSVGPPIFQHEKTNIERALVDDYRRVYGVEYSGFFPEYEFFDATLTERIRNVQETMKQSAVYLVDWTPDFRFLIFRATGGWTAGTYVIVGPDSVTPGMLANIRDDIPREAVVPVSVIDYDARDGLNIPALLTIQDEVRGAGNAPLIVLPHGGPEAYDQYGFDWLAQYFASRGIAVLQPQFRGSTGFGNTLRQAGKGQWGGAMSTDLDDGVQQLIDDGLVDPDRVCMVGLSYGGYAALAAGAFSPFDYKCVVSVSGVSDLPRMLDAERELYGRNSAVVNYLRTQFGSDGEADRTLKPISPVNFADDFKAPVLLIHGRDDAVVAIDQSLRMEKALKRARKPVELLRLKGEDHYLSGYETRIEALRAIAVFIDKNL